MYNPARPNNYKAFKVLQWKRTREAELANDIARTLAESAAMNTPLFGTSATVPPAASSGSYEAGPASVPLNCVHETLPLQLSAEELHQRRVRQSAALGITTAVRLERDELETEHKVKAASGLDRKGRIGSKLGKLMEAAASKGGSSDGGSGHGSGDSSGDLPLDAPPSSFLGSGASLVFEKSHLASGGFMVKESVSSQENRKTQNGKPSSTILIRFIRDGPSPALFEMETSTPISGLGASCMSFLEVIQDQCGRFGVVRSVRHALLSEADQLVVRERLVQAGLSSETEIEARLTRELVRIFVRFDTVASAFKALEALQQQQRGSWSVCFFPTLLFDAGKLGVVDGEPLCC
ncbi:hypothetical protein ERJ75_001005200 [Trypanosoma vivax]|uniref:Uncharacterized protein n=1 Tax=Trypanosoma vivax (strain Y486) TaxID=1055687 RepID=G0TYH3_TRYVY|nr:hypothetical protein TRVL_06443 [Trypanosoma vivax]KAH8611805.1 hypothetical protein ERJ75_001005200 [Trypanosoma vivax]CCC49020.1 conserved hypothetical protein [Trypanosoma vivax Y486]